MFIVHTFVSFRISFLFLNICLLRQRTKFESIRRFFTLHLNSFLCSLKFYLVDRCGAKQSGGLGSSSDTALDGIIGFGQANSSVLSQLTASGKVKKIFSHCLDSIHGGGIFSIGEVIEPKFNTTPLLSGQYVLYLSFCYHVMVFAVNLINCC